MDTTIFTVTASFRAEDLFRVYSMTCAPTDIRRTESNERIVAVAFAGWPMAENHRSDDERAEYAALRPIRMFPQAFMMSPMPAAWTIAAIHEAAEAAGWDAAEFDKMVRTARRTIREADNAAPVPFTPARDGQR